MDADGKWVDPEPDPEAQPTGRCPRCGYPIGYPVQPLQTPDGEPIEPKTQEQLDAERSAAEAATQSAEPTQPAPTVSRSDTPIEQPGPVAEQPAITLPNGVETDSTQYMGA
jgi:hypothetical protein